MSHPVYTKAGLKVDRALYTAARLRGDLDHDTFQFIMDHLDKQEVTLVADTNSAHPCRHSSHIQGEPK